MHNLPGFRSETLATTDREALVQVAELLWSQRGEIAIAWSSRLVAVMPEYFPDESPAFVEQLRAVNEAFLSVVLDRMRQGDLEGLFQAYYDMNRMLIEADLSSAVQRRISLRSLYTSAQIGLGAIEERIAAHPPRLTIPYAQLATHLIMLVGLAYSDAREEALQRAHGELERVVQERTAELAKAKVLADTIIETLPGLFLLIDSHERLVRWNDELEKISGYDPDTLSNRHPLTLFDAANRPFLAEKMREAFITGGASAEAELIARDGSRHLRFFTGKRVHLDQGPFLVGVGIDISERRRAEEGLEREKRFADTIIESLPGIFYLFDEQGRFIRWNHNFEVVSRYSGEEIAGMHPLDFFDGKGQRLVGERIGEVFRTGHSTAEADFVSKDGTRRPYFFTGRRVSVDDGVCLIGMGIDVTERKRAEEALQRARTAQLFAALLESAPDAMVVSDRNGRIVFANSETERLFGYEREGLLGQSVELLIPDAVRQPPWSDEPRPLTASKEAAGRRRDGSRFPAEIKFSPLQTEDGVLLTSAIRDVTERKYAEAQILHLNIDLERRVAQRTDELGRSNADLEQFAYVASHDLQEPLRAVASYTQLLARRYQHRLDGDALRFIDRTVAAVGRMQALIRDLLAYSRAGTRSEQFGPTDCMDVLRDVLDDLQAAISETGAVVTHGLLPVLPADRSQLRQLLQNLIGNAIKFRADTPPSVHVGAQRQGAMWLFTVRDNGIGIEPEYTERVFAIFQRLHSRAAYPGTGVGLAICKKIVERHGGRIWLASTFGKGTTVCFQLPAEPGDERAVAAVGS